MTTDTPIPDDAFEALARRTVREMPDAPPALVQSAIGLWAQATPVTSPMAASAAASAASAATAARQTWREVLAVLRFDSWATSGLALGMRGAASDAPFGAARQLLYSADGHDIDLRIAAGAQGAYSLAGQVMGPLASCTVAVAPQADGAPLLQAELDDLGEFQLHGLTAGRWWLRLSLPGQVIALPPLALGAAAP